jgi:hypothetical protein
MKTFNDACEFHDLELLDDNFNGEVKVKPSELTVKVIKPKDYLNVLDYTVSTFRNKLESFTKKELKIFIKNDSRQTIIKEAKKELSKRK